MRVIVKYFAIVVLLLVCGEASAQKMKERSCVRNGNDYFNKKEFRKSIECYEEALQHDPNSFEAKFDLGSALYSCERYEEAEKTLQPLLENKSLSDVARGEVAYNLGNTQFAQKKYKEALSSYRTAMRCNPNDEDAKFNYAYTKLKLQQQEQQQQQDNQNQDQNQDQNQNQNQDQNKDQQNDQNKDQNQNNNQDKDQNNNQDKDQNKDQQNDQNKDKDNQQNKDDKENKNDQNKDDKQDNKQDDKQDNKQNNNKDKEQPNNDNKNGEQPQNQNGKNDPQQGNEPQPSGVTPEQEAMLQAIQAEEDKTQDKLDKEKAGVLIFRGKNW